MKEHRFYVLVTHLSCSLFKRKRKKGGISKLATCK